MVYRIRIDGSPESYRVSRYVGVIPKRADSITREDVDRELHGSFLHASADLPKVPSEYWFDLRRKRAKPWGNILKRIDELVDADVPVDRILPIGHVICAYAIERCMERDAEKYGRPSSAA